MADNRIERRIEREKALKFKLNKKTGIIIGIIIFVIVLGFQGMTISKKLEEQSKIEKQLNTAQTRLQGIHLESLSSQPADLEKQLNQIMPEFEQVKAKLSQPVSSTAAATALFDVAKTYGLVVTAMTSSSPINESLAGVTLSAMSLTAKVEGNVSKLTSFIAALNNLLKTSAVKSVEITIPEMTNGDNATASIELVVYTYRGN